MTGRGADIGGIVGSGAAAITPEAREDRSDSRTQTGSGCTFMRIVGREPSRQPATPDLRQVARWQRLLIWFVLALIFLVACQIVGATKGMSQALSLTIAFSSVAVQLAALVTVILMMVSLGFSVVRCAVYAVFMLLPCISILVLLSVNSQATNALRRAGIKVRFLGANDEEVLRMVDATRCKACGYIVDGNASGTCPECGVELAAQRVSSPATERRA
jgi:predicted Zn-ribbon and HTH transcriptional regulator